jgi:lysine 6-dehydrogenase
MYVILGLGIQGEAILKYLLKVTKEEIISFDVVDVTKYLSPNVRWKHWCVPKGSTNDWCDDIPQVDNIVVINCLPTEYNLSITQKCITNGWNLVDLGGVTDVVYDQFKLNDSAKQKKISIVPDCGLAPGINISLASKFSRAGADDVEVFCGGIPKYPEPPLSYCEVFYPGGVIKEYSGVSCEIRNGHVEFVPALSGKEFIFVESVGVLEAARTSGGVSISPDHMKLSNYRYKTLRYPGHWDYIQKYIMPQKDPVRALSNLIQPVSIDNPDIIILSFRLNRGEEVLNYFWEYGDGISAMAQATGYTVAAVATMIHNGNVQNGVVGMHEIDADRIIETVRLIDRYQFSVHPLNF